MRVSTRIVAVTGLLAVLLVAVLAYHVSQVAALAGLNETLSSTRFAAARIALEQERLLGSLEEFTLKFGVRRDLDYADKVEELQQSFRGTLAQLEDLRLSPGESTAALALTRLWNDYLDEWRGLLETEEEEGKGGDLSGTLARIESLRAQTRLVAEQTELAIGELRHESRRQHEEARRFARIVAWIAGLLSLPIAWLIVRSITRPLKLLSEGTRAVADGQFQRLEVSGRDELAELATSFNHMVERLRELDELKKDFLANVSHELRTPLVAMRETNQALLDEIPGDLNPQQRRLLELNVRSGGKLSAMISKLLDLARMEAGAMEYDFRPNDLVELVQESVAEFAASPERVARIEFEPPEVPVLVQCDRDRLGQVVDNLLSNAFKFGPPDSAIDVRVVPEFYSPRDQPTALALVEVTDAGPGVPDPEKQKIFDKFHRAPGTKAHSGFGLGLAICREIIDAHSGTIWVEDNRPAGSRFLFALTAIPAQSVAARSRKAS